MVLKVAVLLIDYLSLLICLDEKIEKVKSLIAGDKCPLIYIIAFFLLVLFKLSYFVFS